MEQKDKWHEWEKDIDKVPSECRQAIELLAERFDYKEVTSFKNNLMQIAQAVATAYREFDKSSPFSLKVKMYTELLTERFRAVIERRVPRTADEILNVSEEEHLALAELSEQLRIDEQEGLEPKYDFDPTFQNKEIEKTLITKEMDN